MAKKQTQKTSFFKKNPTHNFASFDEVSDYQAGRQALRDIKRAGMSPMVNSKEEFGLWKKLMKIIGLNE